MMMHWRMVVPPSMTERTPTSDCSMVALVMMQPSEMTDWSMWAWLILEAGRKRAWV